MKIGLISQSEITRLIQEALLREGAHLKVWWPNDVAPTDKDMLETYPNISFSRLTVKHWHKAITSLAKNNDLVFFDSNRDIDFDFVDTARDYNPNVVASSRISQFLEESQELRDAFAKMFGLPAYSRNVKLEGWVGTNWKTTYRATNGKKLPTSLNPFITGLARVLYNSEYRGYYEAVIGTDDIGNPIWKSFNTEPFWYNHPIRNIFEWMLDTTGNVAPIYAQSASGSKWTHPQKPVAETEFDFFWGGSVKSKDPSLVYYLLAIEYLMSENSMHVNYWPDEMRRILQDPRYGFYTVKHSIDGVIGFGTFYVKKPGYIYGDSVAVLPGYGLGLGLKFMRHIHQHMEHELKIVEKTSHCLESALKFHERLGYKKIRNPGKYPFYTVKKVFGKEDPVQTQG